MLLKSIGVGVLALGLLGSASFGISNSESPMVQSDQAVATQEFAGNTCCIKQAYCCKVQRSCCGGITATPSQ
ncbi:hypothetical protein [Novipirellula artificiosorum]|uniref:Uncharacterized protein n=1 Tax=Novipirellula artificiosorum TaxID=2528016 RepID=A0A5C6DRH5_9BACT|nr:hypothetical protein [Novipirellula artificiosorum]TWU39440.1 hypothetical protein Poly41_22640 [Novipirellula artificiosorum]